MVCCCNCTLIEIVSIMLNLLLGLSVFVFTILKRGNDRDYLFFFYATCFLRIQIAIQIKN